MRFRRRLLLHIDYAPLPHATRMFKENRWIKHYLLFVFMSCLSSATALAATLKDLAPGRDWRVGEIAFVGNQIFSDDVLGSELVTRERPWYRVWEKRPLFDPVTFTDDLERLNRFYESRGYYGARITHDLEVDEERSLVNVKILVEENQPVIVSEVNVGGTGGEAAALPPLPETLPLKRGDVFTEAGYQQGERVLRDFLLERGYAHVETARQAEVLVDQGRVRVSYFVDPGPPAQFGRTEVEGAIDVDPRLVLRELSYEPGERFSLEKIADSREKIVRLNLFSSVRISPEPTQGKPEFVPMRVQVVEKPPRDLKIGVGYGTEDRFRAQLEWQHQNWFGGGRQLSLGAKYSFINITGEAKFVQPHLFTPRTQGVISLRQEREEEKSYRLDASRFNPRLEHRFSPDLSGFFGYRLEFHQFDNVSSTTAAALGGVEERGLLSGPSVGILWNTTDDPFNPQRGEILSLSVDQAGEIWGGEYSFYKITAEARKYLFLGWKTVIAGRLKIGVADSIGEIENFPLSERFFAGGEKSVRGFDRRELGPLSASNDPLGGLSLVEGSLELRRPLWGDLGGAVFLDFGQVSTRSFDPPFDNLKFAAGFGASYSTPVGPLRLDVAFPFDPRRGDRSWRIHFNIGASF